MRATAALYIALGLFVSAASAAELAHINITGNTSCRQVPTNQLNFDGITSFLNSCPINTLDDLLARLPPQFIQARTLVFNSKSIQAATPSDPRVLLFSPDAKFVVSFNGVPGESAYNELEMMQFNDKTQAFELRKITFPEAGQQGHATLSSANPAACLNCHGYPPRPRWDAYNLWPGVYGGFDDSLYMVPGGPALTDRFSTSELNAYRAFMNASASNPRYQVLHEKERTAKTLNMGDFNITGSWTQVIMRPNTVLSQSFTALNDQAIAREIMDNPTERALRYAVLGALNCSEPIEDFLPPALKTQLSTPYSAYLKDTNRAAQSNYQSRLNRLAQAFPDADLSSLQVSEGGYEHLEDAQTTAKLRYLLENLGLSMADWSMGISRGSYSFNDGHTGFNDYFWKNLLDPTTDSRLYQTFKISEENHRKDINNPGQMALDPAKARSVCDELKAKSLAALGTTNTWTQVSIAPCQSGPAPAPLDSNSTASLQSLTSGISAQLGPVAECIQCHSSAQMDISRAPLIPFDNPTAMKTLLNQKGYPHGTLAEEVKFRITTNSPARMPLSGGLSPSEISAVDEYLKSISGK